MFIYASVLRNAPREINSKSADFFESLLFSIGFVCFFPFPRIQKTAICCNLSKYIAIFSNRKNYLATQCLPIDS